jgi:hypothetical protein
VNDESFAGLWENDQPGLEEKLRNAYDREVTKIKGYLSDLARNEVMFLTVPLSYDCLLSVDELRFSNNHRHPAEISEAFIFHENWMQKTQISKLTLNSSNFSNILRLENSNGQDNTPEYVVSIFSSH